MSFVKHAGKRWLRNAGPRTSLYTLSNTSPHKRTFTRSSSSSTEPSSQTSVPLSSPLSSPLKSSQEGSVSEPTITPLSKSKHSMLNQLAEKHAKANCTMCGKPKSDPSKVFPRPAYDCPNCGFPTHCSLDCHSKDLAHFGACKDLREMNLDYQYLLDPDEDKPTEHPSPPDKPPLLRNWDTFFTTRGFLPVASPMSNDTMRRVWSAVFTYPLTLAWSLHELKMAKLESNHKLTIMCLGASQVETTLPPHIWLELQYQFPGVEFDLWFLGPEIPETFNTQNIEVNPKLKLHFRQTKYHEKKRRKSTAAREAPAPDVIVCFNSGVGYTNAEAHWGPTLDMILPKQGNPAKYPLVFTSLDKADAKRDIECITKRFGGDIDWKIAPQECEFRSLRKNMNFKNDINHVFAANSTILAL